MCDCIVRKWCGMYACPHTNRSKISHDTIDQQHRRGVDTGGCSSVYIVKLPAPVVDRMEWKKSHVHKQRQHQLPPSVINFSALKVIPMAFNEDSSASGHDEPWIQW